MATLLSHETLADLVAQTESALRGVAALGTSNGAGYRDDVDYGFGCLAAILADKLAEVFCALNDWVMHDRDVRPPAGAPTMPDAPPTEIPLPSVTPEDVTALVRRLPPSAQQQLLHLLRSLGAARDADIGSLVPEEG